jgi:hypothetical protein
MRRPPTFGHGRSSANCWCEKGRLAVVHRSARTTRENVSVRGGSSAGYPLSSLGSLEWVISGLAAPPEFPA